MHIPGGMLNGAVCPATAAVAAIAVGIAGYFAIKSKEKPGAEKFFTGLSLIFVMQMLNFPIQSGTSGHFLGGVFAAYLLGTPFAAIAMSIVLTVQAVIFGDGGLSTLGANIVNMVVIGSVLPGIIINSFKNKNNIKSCFITAAASFISVVAASFACAVEVGISNVFEMGKGISAMVSVHSVIGTAEGIITAILCVLVSRGVMKGKQYALIILALIAATPFASSNPDGLEYVVEKIGKFAGTETYIKTVFYDYSVSFIQNSYISTIVSALTGVIVMAVVTVIFYRRKNK